MLIISNRKLTETLGPEDYEKLGISDPEVWAIMLSYKRPVRGVRWVPTLAPSSNTFRIYWGNPEFNMNVFKQEYVPSFLRDMCDERSRKALCELWDAAQTRNIIAICACSDESMCHRSIVAGIVGSLSDKNGRPMDVRSLSGTKAAPMLKKVNEKYLAYGEAYLRTMKNP